MCLDNVSKSPPKSEGVGYKIFHWAGESLFGQYCHDPSYAGGYPSGEWLINSGPTRIVCPTTRLGEYPSGFHIFLNEADAVGWDLPETVVRRVKYRKAHTRGHWIHCTTVVASEMWIEPETQANKGDSNASQS